MGADLYIKSITEPARKQWDPIFKAACAERDAATARGDKAAADAAQEKVGAAYDAMFPEGGYFRDSYNATCVLSTMDLSWWRDVIPLLTRAGYLRGDNLRKLIEMIEARQVPPAADLDLYGAQVDSAGENSREGWHAYFVEKREKLLRFLRSANGRGIYCSL